MKSLILLIITININLISYANTITAVLTSGSWTSNSTWDLNTTPANNDIVIIPVGKTVTINSNINYGTTTFIIKVYGTLTLIGSGSKLTISGSSDIIVYPGGIINSTGSASQTIKIGGNTVYQGDQTPIVGAQYANNTTGNGFFPLIILPVKFISFTVTGKYSDVLIQWSATEELNADRYELERSFNGSSWTTVSYLPAKGLITNVASYSYLDKNVSEKIIYYRIKQVDDNGQFTYTAIESVRLQNAGAPDIKIAAYAQKLSIQFPQEIKGNVMVRFVSLSGQIVTQQSISHPVGQVLINTNSSLKGNYIISVSNGQEVNIARQVIL